MYSLWPKGLPGGLRAVFLCVMLVAVILFPALAGWLVYEGDSTDQVIPQLAFYKRAFQNQETPFWNSYLAAGFTNFISVGGFPFSPLNLLALFLSPSTAHYFGLFLVLSLSAFFFVLFLRELGVSEFGAFIGVMAYLAGNIWYTRNLTLSFGLLTAPVLFWVLMRISKNTKTLSTIKYIIFGGLIVGSGLLMTNYWQSLYLFVASFAFLIFNYWSNFNRALFFKPLSALFLIFGLGFLIGLPQILPTYVISGLSGRAGGLDYHSAQGYALSLKEISYFFHRTSNIGPEAYLFMGIVPLIFLFFGFLRKDRASRFFIGLFVVSLALSINGSPLFWLISKLPLFDLFEGAARFMLIGIFASAALVGLGVENFYFLIRSGALTSIKKVINSVYFLIFAALILSFIIWRSSPALFSIALSAIFLTIAYFLISKSVNKSIFFPIVVLLVVAEFISVFYLFNKPFALKRSEYERPPATLEFLQKHPGKVLPILVEDWDDQYFWQIFKTAAPSVDESQGLYSFDLWRETYKPNTNLLWPVSNLEILDPLLNTSNARLLALLGTRSLSAYTPEPKLDKTRKLDEGKDFSIYEKFRLFKERLPLAGFLGVKYFLSGFDLETFDIRLPLVGEYSLELLKDPETPLLGMLLYENPYAKPLAYFAYVAGFDADADKIYQLFKSSNFRGVYVQCSSCPGVGSDVSGSVDIALEKNGYAKLETSARGERFLVFSQNYLPGWRAFIDGKEVKMHKVNTIFPGIFVPAGTHNVEFKYDYFSLFDPKFILRQIE